MIKWQQILVGCVAVALAAGGATVARATDRGQQRIAPQPAGAQPAARGDGATESRYRPISPCRIVDTRVGGGSLKPAKKRYFNVLGAGANFAAQGGQPGGCKIPAAARAVQATVTAVAPTGGGYLKSIGTGSVPVATFLSYGKGASTSNGGVFDICLGLCINDIGLLAFSHSTQVVIDVQGYFIPPMWVHVLGNGTIDASSRTRGAKRLTTGRYQVNFDRSIGHCGLSANPYYGGGAALVTVANQDTSAIVATADAAGVAKDGEFYLNVSC